MKLGKAMLKRQTIRGYNYCSEGRIVLVDEDEFQVRVMATAEGYAMVRRKGAMPFVCRVKELRPVT